MNRGRRRSPWHLSRSACGAVRCVTSTLSFARFPEFCCVPCAIRSGSFGVRKALGAERNVTRAAGSQHLPLPLLARPIRQITTRKIRGGNDAPHGCSVPRMMLRPTMAAPFTTRVRHQGGQQQRRRPSGPVSMSCLRRDAGLNRVAGAGAGDGDGDWVSQRGADWRCPRICANPLCSGCLPFDLGAECECSALEGAWHLRRPS
jgi:hypothetical protein